MLCIASLLLGRVSLATAETFTCTARDVGCLIASIAKANANGPDHDTVRLAPGSYLLDRADNDRGGYGANGLPVVTGALTLVGDGGEGVTLLARKDGAPFFRLLEIASTGTLTIQGVTLARGELDLNWFQHGGCLWNHGTLTLRQSVVRECAAWLGGGVASEGPGLLLIQRSVLTENLGDFVCGGVAAIGPATIEGGTWIHANVAELGAGVCGGDRGPLTIRSAVIADNLTTGHNGGGVLSNGVVTIQSTLLSENVSFLFGGAISHAQGTLTLRNSTVWANTAEIDGGGLSVEGGDAALTGVAIVANTAVRGVGGGLATRDTARTTLERSWILFNTARRFADCVGPLTLRSWNVVSHPGQVQPAGTLPCTE